MRLIDADELLKDIEKYRLSDGKFQLWVEVQSTVDAVPVIRCIDCVWYEVEELKADGTLDMRYKPSMCSLLRHNLSRDGYCSLAERKDT